MTHTVTPLGQTLATPGTGEPFSTAVVNGNLLLLENGIFADRVRLGSLESLAVLNLADLNSLTGLNASTMEGRRVHVDAMNCDFEAIDGLWTQQGSSSFPDAATRDAEYAKASTAYRIANVRSKIVTETFERSYSTTLSAWRPDSRLAQVPITPASVAGTGVSISDGKVVFTAAPSISVNGCFTTDFDNYLIILNTTAKSSVVDSVIQMRVAGVNAAGANYNYARGFDSGTTRTVTSAPTATSMLCDVGGGLGDSLINLFAPALAQPTRLLAAAEAAGISATIGGVHSLAVAHDGFTISSAANLTGSLRVIGLTS